MKKHFCIILTALFFLAGIVSAQNPKKPGYAIFIDNSGSMRTQLAFQIEIAKEVVKQIDNESFITLFIFANDGSERPIEVNAQLVIECSSDKNEVIKQIEKLVSVRGQTTLLDAIKTASESLGSAKSSKCGELSERNLILLTDGEDRASVTEAKDLPGILKQSEAKVLAVGVLQDLTSQRGFLSESPREKYRKFLEKITKDTGGKVVFPKKDQTASEIVKQLFEVASKSSK